MDLYRYDDRWEKQPTDALHAFFAPDDALASTLLPITSKVKPQPQTSILDLRQPLDFQDFHLPGSVNLPLVHEVTPSPFAEPRVLDALWRRMEETFQAPGAELLDLVQGRRVLVLCYDGDSARVATSVLRAKGYEADSVGGGFRALRRLREESHGASCASNGIEGNGMAAFMPSSVPVAAQAV